LEVGRFFRFGGFAYHRFFLFLSPFLPFFEFGQGSSAFSFGEAALFEVGGFSLSTGLLGRFLDGRTFFIAVCFLLRLVNVARLSHLKELFAWRWSGFSLSAVSLFFFESFSNRRVFYYRAFFEQREGRATKMLERSRNCGTGGATYMSFPSGCNGWGFQATLPASLNGCVLGFFVPMKIELAV
jgi:hypothetical protein